MQIKIAFVSFILSLSQEFRAFVLFVFCFYFRFVYPKTKFLRAILALPRPIKRAQQTLTHTNMSNCFAHAQIHIRLLNKRQRNNQKSSEQRISDRRTHFCILNDRKRISFVRNWIDRILMRNDRYCGCCLLFLLGFAFPFAFVCKSVGRVDFWTFFSVAHKSIINKSLILPEFALLRFLYF